MIPFVVLRLDGVVFTDDLPVQSFARHLSTISTAAGSNGQPIIAGMRAFLENKPHLMPDPPWTQPPATGERAVELLAVAAGCSDDDIVRARAASRHDLAASAWMLDPADGFQDLLDLLAGRARPIAIADRDDPATAPLLESLELTERLTAVDGPELSTVLGDGPLLLIDTAWTPWLADAHSAGHTTALIDRFGSFETTDGDPDLRARDLAGLLPGIADWLAAPATVEGEGP